MWRVERPSYHSRHLLLHPNLDVPGVATLLSCGVEFLVDAVLVAFWSGICVLGATPSWAIVTSNRRTRDSLDSVQAVIARGYLPHAITET